MISVIDYGAGNLQSVVKAFRHIGCEVSVVNGPEELKTASAAVLPGVGAFGDAMGRLKQSEMADSVLEFIASGRPFLGICLGLQLLFEESEESPGVKGLGVLQGKICRIPDAPGLKVPHVGWNSLNLQKSGGILSGLPHIPYVYFVHSYYLRADDRQAVSSTVEYGVKIDASVEHGNIYATQFHPEKSGAVGLAILRNFVSLIP